MSDTTESEAPLSPAEDILADLRSAMASKAEAPEPVETAPEPEAPEETAEERDTRLRDERGRFAKAAEEPAAPEEQPQETEADKPPEAPKVEPPATWPEAEKAMFAKVPPELQQFMVKRYAEQEADYTRKTTQIAAFRRDFEPVAQLFEPHRNTMREKGFTPASLIKGYIETEGGLMDANRAPSVAARLIKAYQIPPEAIMRELGWQPPTGAAPQEGDPAPAPMPALPPEVVNLLNGVMQKTQTLEQHFMTQQQAAQAQAEQRVMAEIDRFKVEAGPDGRPLRPYFAEVEQDMADIGNMVVQKGGDMPPLQELYETAVYANPITRARILADQSAAIEAQRVAKEAKARDEARAKAVQARKASAPVTGAPGTGHGVAANGAASLRDELREAMRLHS